MRTILFLICLMLAHAASAAPINVATYNLRNSHADDGPNAWPARKDMVKALIRYHDFDIATFNDFHLDRAPTGILMSCAMPP
jgi:hypothetical protein